MANLVFRNGQDISPSEFKDLSPIQQQQLLFTLNNNEQEYQEALQKGLLGSIKKRWKEYGGELCEFWQVAEENAPETMLYDVWIWNVDTGCVFISNTVNYTQISMIQLYFDPQVRERDDVLDELVYDLEEAFKRKPKYRKEISFCKLNPQGEIIGFISDDKAPLSPKEWNKLFANKVSQDFIRTYQNQINKKGWELISQYSALSEDFIEEFAKKVSWKHLSQYQKFSESFIRKHQTKVDWVYISFKQVLSEEFILEFQDKVEWSYISSSQKLSEDFIRKHQKLVEWDSISWGQKLSEDFLREFQKKINWTSLCMYQPLSEDFIREFKHKVDWHYLASTQKLSVAFVKEFSDKINMSVFSYNQHLTQEHIEVFFEQISWSNLVYFSSKTKELLTEELLYKLRDKYPNKEYWKDLFPYIHHLSKEFKANFLKAL